MAPARAVGPGDGENPPYAPLRVARTPDALPTVDVVVTLLDTHATR